MSPLPKSYSFATLCKVRAIVSLFWFAIRIPGCRLAWHPVSVLEFFSIDRVHRSSSFMVWQRVCIIGVGLLGGSIGLALKRKRLAKQVVGVGRTIAKLDTALQRGAIDIATDDIIAGAKDTDLVIACTPVQSIVDSLAVAASVAVPNVILTDVGSTKQSIIRGAEGRLSPLQYIGSHPIAGGHHSGVEHAVGTLLDGALVVITPSESNPPELVDRMSRFWESMGSRICNMLA